MQLEAKKVSARWYRRYYIATYLIYLVFGLLPVFRKLCVSLISDFPALETKKIDQVTIDITGLCYE
jgi:hypothetical protein